MFVTVLFGDSRQELFNLNCKLINFIYDLKERCGLDRKDCVDLMDRCGQVTSLSEKEQSAARAASLLTERHSYVLLRVCRCEESQGQKYESLLNNLSKSHPELAECQTPARNVTNGALHSERRKPLLLLLLHTQRAKTYQETRGTNETLLSVCVCVCQNGENILKL
ncbi:uncharacterized protein C22orf15 isoform X1 [Gadus chalcogrammus]|uniref:uncharacterized protein C22orf15 isoform X1 n=1 Tax=Gadus chalcogrammus TaxID=1042646 RepID=UPI0024C3B2F0|nr:uncharacterized protein C22orf15 isoform X1 [Gadus chalcogrammus]